MESSNSIDKKLSKEDRALRTIETRKTYRKNHVQMYLDIQKRCYYNHREERLERQRAIDYRRAEFKRFLKILL